MSVFIKKTNETSKKPLIKEYFNKDICISFYEFFCHLTCECHFKRQGFEVIFDFVVLPEDVNEVGFRYLFHQRSPYELRRDSGFHELVKFAEKMYFKVMHQ